MLNWNDIKGHQRNKDVLERAVASDRLHHALLFAGPDGVGKRALCRALASAINCTTRQLGEFSPACGTCSSCRKNIQLIHPDLMLVEPQGNVIKTIKIEQIRQIQKSATMPPFEAREQIVIIFDAHLMGNTAANALLKTLEEPSGRMRMMLTTDQPHLLLDTIISRCQLLRFGALTREDVSSTLQRLIPDDDDLKPYATRPDMLSIAAAFGEGSVGRAAEILKSGMLEERKELIDRVKSLRQRHPMDYLDMAEDIAKGKDKSERLFERLDVIKVFMRDVMRMQVAQGSDSTATLVNLDMQAEVERWAHAYSTQDTLNCIDAIHAAQDLIGRRVNAQLVVERALRKIQPTTHQQDLLYSR